MLCQDAPHRETEAPSIVHNGPVCLTEHASLVHLHMYVFMRVTNPPVITKCVYTVLHACETVASAKGQGAVVLPSGPLTSPQWPPESLRPPVPGQL